MADLKPSLKVSFTTVCMGRLGHLRRTLIKNLEHNKAYPRLEVVLLDYNSNDGLEEWIRKNCRYYIETGMLVYYKTTEPTHFKMAHSKNMAALLATGDVLVNVDADNYTGEGFAKEINRIFSENEHALCRCSKKESDHGSGGRLAMMRETFFRLGGYDESMIGWGLEDGDLRQRARRLGVHYKAFNADFCRAVFHDDTVREANHTPPGQPHLTVFESANYNRKIFEQHMRSDTMAVNRDMVWGEGTCIKNFRHKIKVGSNLMNGHRLEVRDAIPPPAVPNIDRAAAIIAPMKAEALLNKTKSAGHFVLSNLRARQINEKP